MTVSVATSVSLAVSASPAAPSAAQVARLRDLGCVAIPSTKSEASKEIDRLTAQRDCQPATPGQKAYASALRGRDLPGSGIREKSTQIYLLEVLDLFDRAEAQEDINQYAEMLIARVRERFVHPMKPLAQLSPVQARAAASAPAQASDSEQAPF